jgi:G3E family GTPase
VDAVHLEARLADSHEAAEQIAFADVILLNKIDLVSSLEVARIQTLIARMNPTARIVPTRNCDIAISDLLDLGAFDLDRILEIEPGFLGEDEHEHDEAVVSVSMSLDKPLDSNRARAWVSSIASDLGQDILRWKGILHIAGQDRRLVFQGVHMLLDVDLQRPWREDETRVSRAVFIGRDLPAARLKAGFEACAVR